MADGGEIGEGTDMGLSIRARSFCEFGGRWSNCIRHYVIPEGWDASLPSVAATSAVLAAKWGGAHKTLLPSSARYAGLEWELIEDGIPLFLVSTELQAGAGQRGPGCLPTQLCTLMHFPIIGETPTRARGLTYLPFVAADTTGGTGELTDAALATANMVAESLGTVAFDSLGRPWQPAVRRRSTDELIPLGPGFTKRGLAQQRRRGLHWPALAAPEWA